MPAFARVLKLRGGDEGEALIASFIESHRDPALIPPFADLDVNADIAVPLPRAEPINMRRGTRRSCCASMPSCCFGTTRRVP